MDTTMIRVRPETRDALTAFSLRLSVDVGRKLSHDDTIQALLALAAAQAPTGGPS